MAKLKKYEDAKGVVPLFWRAGQPGSDELWNGRLFLAETWSASLAWHDPTQIAVRAAIRFVKWDGTAFIDLETNKPLPDGMRWRRWTCATSNWVHKTILVGDWE